MSSISDYKSRVSGSIVDGIKTNTANSIKYSFKDSPSYYQVQVYTPTAPLTPSNLDSWIVDDSKIKELKQIQLIPDQTLNFGDIVIWNGEHWITLQVDYQGGIYYRGSIQRCYSSIKWLDATGDIREAWFTLTTDTSRSLGIQDGKVLIMPYERRYLAIQSNVYTQQIRKDQRFIFDNRVWKTVSVDGLLTGVIMLTLEENLESVNDRMDLRIADYTNNVHTYSISILNGASAALHVNDTLQLNVEVKDNDVVSSLPVTYASSDVTIATIDVNGLVTTLAEGSVTISAAIADHPTVTTSILLSISTVVIDNFTVNIAGADECKVTQMQSYIATVNNNGIVDDTKTVAWSLLNDLDNGVTDLATIQSQTGTNCVVQANSASPYRYGFVRLIATKSDDGTVTQVKRIKIRSLF